MKLSPQEIFKFFKSKSIDELKSIPDIGPEVARSIFEFFHDHHNEQLVEKLTKAGVKVSSEKVKSKNEKLNGKIFVLTGKLSSINREEAKEKIRWLGGQISESVSKKTSFVVVGDEPGSKHEKARQLGIKIIDEQKFIDMIG